MLLESPSSWATTPVVAFAFAILVVIVQLVRTWVILRQVPGPFWSKITNIPRMRWVLSNHAHEKHIALHRQYGPLVRFGPNMVSVSDPSEIPNIYGFTGKFVKSDFYHVLLFTVKGKGIPGLFATQDEGLHRALKRPIASIYSMSNLVSFEPLVDSTIRYFFQRLDERFVRTGVTCDLDSWLQMFAFDTMGEITFSRRLGFLESGSDIGSIMHNIWNYFVKAAPVTQMPWLDYVWTKNPLVQAFQVVPPNAIVQFAMARAAERKAMDAGEYEAKAHLYRRDFLTRLTEASEKSTGLPPWTFSAWLTSNITAGSDTTAILLRTIVHQLLRHPEALARLRAELEPVARPLLLDSIGGVVPWASVARAATDLPFLDAVVKESARLHPPFGLPLERVVPAGGTAICGQSLPAGTVVGMSPWVVGRDVAVYGERVDDWVPDRWLRAGPEQRRRMEAASLTFGAGNRVCLGRNISLLEVYKLIPSLVMQFNMEFEDSTNCELKVANRWFVNNTGLRVRLSKRESE